MLLFLFQPSCGYYQRRLAAWKLSRALRPSPHMDGTDSLTLGGLRSDQHRPLQRLQVFPFLLGANAFAATPSQGTMGFVGSKPQGNRGRGGRWASRACSLFLCEEQRCLASAAVRGARCLWPCPAGVGCAPLLSAHSGRSWCLFAGQQRQHTYMEGKAGLLGF